MDEESIARNDTASENRTILCDSDRGIFRVLKSRFFNGRNTLNDFDFGGLNRDIEVVARLEESDGSGYAGTNRSNSEKRSD